MKNLKKVLSLALALVMAMSLMTTAFAADYADIDDVNYTEAVEVMTAVGVFNGVGGDKFAPDATLDRASAAKLIAYLDLGADEADALVGTGALFTDVPADYWAAGYIEYMAAAGYTNGTGNDKFSPKATVTGLEFGKWLLTVLGYDASIEEMTGASWGINTSKVANAIGLFDGVSAKASANLTREAAAVYCLNALQSDTVYYQNKGTNITIGDTTVNTGASAVASDNRVANTQFTALAGAANNNVLQLVEKLYGADLQKSTTNNIDAFDRPGTTWTLKGKTIGTYTEEATATYTNTVKNNVLYNLFGKAVVNDMLYTGTTVDDRDYYITVQVDGNQLAADDNYYVIPNNSSDVVYTGAGKTTEVFVDSTNKLIDVVVTTTQVAEVLGDYNANTEKVFTSIGYIFQETEDQEGFEVKDLKEGDIILYTYANSAIQSVEKAELMTGVVSTYVANESVTVDGTAYGYTTDFYTYDNNTLATTYKLGETATFAMDGMGNIAAILELTESTDANYVYVENIGVVAGRTQTIMADIVKVDGTEVTDATIKSIDGESDAAVVDANATYYTVGWYSFTMDGAKYKIANDDVKAYYVTATAGTNLFTKGAIAIGDGGEIGAAKANSATTFIIKDKDDAITTYAGIADVPTLYAQANVTAYVLNGSDGFADYVYVDMVNNSTLTYDASTSTSDDVFYVLKASGTKVVAGTEKDTTVEYVTLDVLKDGKVQNVDVLATSGLQDGIGRLYTDAIANDDNRVESATLVNSNRVVDTYEGIVDSVSSYYITYASNVLTVKDGLGYVLDLSVANDAVVYVVMPQGCSLMDDTNAKYEVETMSVAQVAGMLKGYTADFTMTYFTVDKDSSVVNTIYLTLDQATAL